MKTSTWETLKIFDNPINGRAIKLVDSPLEMPGGVEEIIRKNWDKQLREKQGSLSSSNITTEILPYHQDNSENPLNALYEDDKPKMWPGPVVSLKEISIHDSGIDLHVGQTYFPFIAALKDEEVSKLYTDKGITKPRPALAICTYALTTDNHITLTVRSIKTNMYPGRAYGQGGNPLFTNTDIVYHQMEEMKEEILVCPKEYNLDSFMFAGIVVDREDLPDKPDLIGWIPVSLESEEILERVSQREMSQRPNDAIGVSFIPSSEGELFDTLSHVLSERINKDLLCPPALGGLFLYGKFNFGDEWVRRLLKKIDPPWIKQVLKTRFKS